MTSVGQEGAMTPEQYLAEHKRAFRVAFDYLNAHFPPDEGEDYWVRAATDIGKACEKNNGLMTELLCGVYAYLEKEWKIRHRTEAEQVMMGV